MSRTDRDAPFWTHTTWWTPWHRCAALFRTEYPGHARLTRHRRADARPFPALPPGCDLPAAPVPHRAHTRCEWTPVDARRQDGPTRTFILTTWTRPQRARVRVDCHLAIHQHRATGTVDIEPSTAHHRHTARWHW